MFSFEDYLLKLLTHKELKTLKKRFTIIQLLKSNLTYRKITQKTGISTTTVVRLNQRLKIRKRIRKEQHRKIDQSAGGKVLKNSASSVDSVSQSCKLPWKIG